LSLRATTRNPCSQGSWVADQARNDKTEARHDNPQVRQANLPWPLNGAALSARKEDATLTSL